MCMSGEWSATQGAIFKSLHTLSAVALNSRGAQMCAHIWYVQVDEVRHAATSLMELHHKAKDFLRKKKNCYI